MRCCYLELGPFFACCGSLFPTYTFIHTSSCLFPAKTSKRSVRAMILLSTVERSFPLYTPETTYTTVHINLYYCTHQPILLYTSTYTTVHINLYYCTHQPILLYTSTYTTVHINLYYCTHQPILLYTSTYTTVHINLYYCTHQPILLYTSTYTTVHINILLNYCYDLQTT